ncbi:3139_t:CDS:2 [Ambispora gerdemannii]|uniref:3139_t:CDS:1 n=1 Tax=Ambispora gerdemannii TaxID=144530 RepID=A0A9N9FAN2_9GLOM|nr:3139_t:CDS:2 [Ambispora gerdemannii]
MGLDAIQLGIEYSEHEDEIKMLRQKIGQQAGELDIYVNKLRELDRLIKDLEESITSTRERSAREMRETIELTTNTTAGLVEKVTMMKNRIRDKSNILKQHQQLLTRLQNQVEMEKQSARLLANYKTMFAACMISVLVWLIFKWQATNV